MAPRLFASSLAALLGAGCVAEPSLLCDQERIVWALDEVEIGPEQDVSEEPGIQIDVVIRTSLAAGVEVDLQVLDEEGEVQVSARGVVREDGTALFSAVTLPVGRITLEMTAHNGCRLLRSTRNVFVFDDMGRPTCLLGLAQEAIARPAYPLPVLNAESDAEPTLDDFQADFSVYAGRSDVEVRLLVVDVESGEETFHDDLAGESLTAHFRVTLRQGRQAVRAVCRWHEVEVTRSSQTVTYFVDTVPPACELWAPAAPVTPDDDIGGEPGVIRFDLRGLAEGDDVLGESAVFTVGGQEVAGTPIDESGESVAEGAIPDPPPAVQAFSFATTDHAGNRCLDAVTFGDPD